MPALKWELDLNHWATNQTTTFKNKLNREMMKMSNMMRKTFEAYTPEDTGNLKGSLTVAVLNPLTWTFRYSAPYAFWVYIKPNSKGTDHWVDRCLADNGERWIRELVFRMMNS